MFSRRDPRTSGRFRASHTRTPLSLRSSCSHRQRFVPPEATPPDAKPVAAPGFDRLVILLAGFLSTSTHASPGRSSCFPPPRPGGYCAQLETYAAGAPGAAAAGEARRGRRRLRLCGTRPFRAREGGGSDGRGSASSASGANQRGPGAATHSHTAGAAARYLGGGAHHPNLCFINPSENSSQPRGPVISQTFSRKNC